VGAARREREVAGVTGPRDEDLDASCFDDQLHLATFGFALNTDEDRREGIEREDELAQDDEEGQDA
jgi:hypothetical protein